MKKISRRQFIERGAIASLPFILIPRTAKSWTDASINYQIVEIQHGKLRGYREKGVSIFKGIPYAGNVSGTKRFQKAGSVMPWIGIRDALQLGHPSIQPPNQTYGVNEPEPDEDCLLLNIWTPASDSKKRPVMVYNHGGGYQTGSGGALTADGSNLARMFDVVVVETNHRLGLLGFLYLDNLGGEEFKGSGNRGIQDILMALKWINQNIEQFGGNPENVMIFGESGGGMKTSCLYAMPEAAPYFNKASIESGPGVQLIPLEVAIQTTRLVLDYLNISPKNWQKLLEIPTDKLLEAQLNIPKEYETHSGGFRGLGNSGTGHFGAVKDGIVLPNYPFEPTAPEISKNKPLLVGWNEDEYIFFAMIGSDKEVFTLTEDQLKNRLEKEYGENAELIQETYLEANPGKTPGEIYIAIRSIMMMGLGSITIAERKTQQGGAPAYLYNFGYKSNAKIPGTEFEFGSMHAMDIPFKFCNVETGMSGTKPDRFEAANNMAAFWTNFAKTGKPVADGQPEWPVFNLNSQPTMRIDTHCQVINNRFKTERKMWKKILQ